MRSLQRRKPQQLEQAAEAQPVPAPPPPVAAGQATGGSQAQQGALSTEAFPPLAPQARIWTPAVQPGGTAGTAESGVARLGAELGIAAAAREAAGTPAAPQSGAAALPVDGDGLDDLDDELEDEEMGVDGVRKEGETDHAFALRVARSVKGKLGQRLKTKPKAKSVRAAKEAEAARAAAADAAKAAAAAAADDI